jgi:hypothetical protein
MNNVIFLDVDGVLNRNGYSPNRLEPELLKQLARIIDETNATIVLSSFWRLSPSLVAKLESAFADYGLVIHSHTPNGKALKTSRIVGGTQRGYEIQQWMDENWTPDRFVILDDNSDMVHLMPYLVKTPQFVGLTQPYADEAIKRLTPPSTATG